MRWLGLGPVPGSGWRQQHGRHLACNQREQAWWDQYLNSNYDSLQSALDPAVFDTLKVAQRAWVKYRDAKCAFADALAQGGTIRQIASSSCMMETTGSRAAELADVLTEQYQ